MKQKCGGNQINDHDTKVFLNVLIQLNCFFIILAQAGGKSQASAFFPNRLLFAQAPRFGPKSEVSVLGSNVGSFAPHSHALLTSIIA